MRLTYSLFNDVTGYRQGLKAIWNDFYVNVEKLERYKGSKAYSEDIKKETDDRNARISELKKTYREKFNNTILAMEERVKNAPAKTPTVDQINMLQVLKMKNSLSENDIKEAVKALHDNPMCMSVLREMVEDNGDRVYNATILSRELSEYHADAFDAKVIIDNIRASVKEFLSLEKPDSRREMVTDYLNGERKAIRPFAYDREFASEKDVISFFGNINDPVSFMAEMSDGNN